MAQHIGIVGCSAEGTALCYRTICAEGAELFGSYAHPEISVNTPPLADYVSCLEKGDIEGVADIMLSSAAPFVCILLQVGDDPVRHDPRGNRRDGS